MGYDNNKRPINNGNKYNSYNKYSGQNKTSNFTKKDGFGKSCLKNSDNVQRNNKFENRQDLKLNNTNKNKTYGNSNNFTFKSDDDIYTPKVYAKKPKEKSFFDDLIFPEYIEDKQRMRNKRANDKKYKNKYNH